MNNTFINKVMAERAVLRIVNVRTPGMRQLTGLSWTAIDAWQRSSGAVGDQVLVDELKAISDLCQCLSDRSHETFAPLDPAINTMIDSRMQALARLLESRSA